MARHLLPSVSAVSLSKNPKDYLCIIIITQTHVQDSCAIKYQNKISEKLKNEL